MEGRGRGEGGVEGGGGDEGGGGRAVAKGGAARGGGSPRGELGTNPPPHRLSVLAARILRSPPPPSLLSVLIFSLSRWSSATGITPFLSPTSKDSGSLENMSAIQGYQRVRAMVLRDQLIASIRFVRPF